MKYQPHNQLSPYGPRGQRLYLNEAERGRFLKVLEQSDERTRLLGLVLFYTGCRLSEALELTPEHIQAVEGVIVFRTLKRRKLVMREVPVPHWLAKQLAEIKEPEHSRSFICHRATAWRKIKALTLKAGISGEQATPKGLRHSFAVHAICSGVPLNLLQQWMGHAQLATTLLYIGFNRKTTRHFAKKMW